MKKQKITKDIYIAEDGRGCKCGLMFPILLFLNGMTSCPNYEEDIEKINKSMENYD